MKQVRYEFILQASQPIAHHSETFGNTAVAMRRKIRQPDGSFATVPIITADTMRHGLREASAYALLDAVGMLDSPSLTESALRLLFAGGAITGADGAGAVKLDAYREMTDLCPPLAMLGGCASNRSVPGRIFVDDAILICDESSAMLSPWALDWLATNETVVDTARTHIEEVQRVRMDPTLVPHHRALMSDGGESVTKRLSKGEKAAASKDAVGKDDAKSTMMPRRFETVVAGSLFSWGIQATCINELDVDTLHTMMSAFLTRAVVGGKRGTGHGHIVPIAARDIAITRPRDASTVFDLAAPERRVGELFRSHVRERADKVRAWLAGVDA